MTRIRIEGLLAAFPKLIGTENKQHTFVETESVRYVYQPLDGLYLLVITNRASNIVEDLDTLRLLSKIVPNVTGTAGNLTEDKVIEKAFDLLFAFDEVLTAGGYREPVSLQQIRTNMEMESHEEKLAQMIKLSKMETAKDQATAAAKAIKEKQREAARTMPAAGGLGSQSGIGSGSSFDLSTPSSLSGSSNTSTAASTMNARASSLPSSKPMGGSGGGAIKGMALGAGPGRTKAFEDALMKEDKLAPLPTSSTLSAPTTNSTAPAPMVVQQPIMLSMAEKVSGKINRDGILEVCEIKGSLSLTALSDQYSSCAIQLGPKKANIGNLFSFNTHPKINKAVYEKQQLLSLKAGGGGFPSGRPVGVLKWTSNANPIHGTAALEEIAPLMINAWPEESGRGVCTVSLDFSTTAGVSKYLRELHEIKIHIPLGVGAGAPQVVSLEEGQAKHIANSTTPGITGPELLWEIDFIDLANGTSTNGSLEFTVQQKDMDAFFPIHVSFLSPNLYADLEVREVTVLAADGTADVVPFGLAKNLSVEEYTIG